MAVICRHFSLLSPLPPPLPPPSHPQFPPRRSSSARFAAASSSSSRSPSPASSMEAADKFMEFPHVLAPHRSLMIDLVSAAEERLGSQLLPCALPPDVRCYQNDAGSARGSLYVRRGQGSSKVDFLLGSWLNCQLPTGGSLNITSLSAYLNNSTDAPNFLFELIQSSPTSLVLILDLPPRKDLVTSPDYLSTFYEETQLESRRQVLEKLPEAQPYFSLALYIRCVVSPTAIMLRIESEAGKAERLDEIVEKYVSPVAKEVLGIWLDKCAVVDRNVEEEERAYLERRDGIIKRKTIEIDLGSSFPRLFGTEIANRVLDVLKEVYGV
ncbi:hypothetical protein NL676_014355 [Syzygium grande]|nr:hypothetical protein NL676_014355 [Syzygium grande]